MSSLLQIVGQTSGVSHLLAVDSNGKLGINDSTAQGSLSSIASSVGGTLSVSDATAQGSLTNIASSVGGTLVVSDSTAQGSLSSIASSVGGTLSVSSPAISTTSVSLASAVSVADSGTFTSASNDLGAVKEYVILGSSADTSAQIKTEISVDGSTWIENSEVSVYLNNGVFTSHQKSLARYVRFVYNNQSGGAKTITMDISHKA